MKWPLFGSGCYDTVRTSAVKDHWEKMCFMFIYYYLTYRVVEENDYWTYYGYSGN